jgi:type VI secretion system protein ImpH
MPDLIAALRERPQGFDLFQALSLLERAYPDKQPIGTSLGLDEAVRMAAQVDLSFAVSDVAGIDESGRHGPALTLRSGAVTLAGGHGPLPIPFTELLLERRRAGDRAGLEFLDIFNQRLLALLYRGRRKHNVALDTSRDDTEPLILGCLDALSGLGRAEGARGPAGERAWLRHAGLQGAAPRSMTSLLALLRDRLKIRFDGRQFAGGWHPVSMGERAVLRGRGPGMGLGTRLGQRGTLGARAWDQEAGIELTTPPLPPARFARLLPGGRENALLGWLASRHLQRETQIVLTVGVDNPPSTLLAPDSPLPPRLGLSAWLRSPPRAAGAAVDARWSPQAPRFVLPTRAAAPAAERT